VGSIAQKSAQAFESKGPRWNGSPSQRTLWGKEGCTPSVAKESAGKGKTIKGICGAPLDDDRNEWTKSD
jgi:hypothetical protein